MKKLIQKLTETFSPSGYESAVREIIRAEVHLLADEIRVDALGSLIVRKGPTQSKAKGTPSSKKIMVAAHMDEIGLAATHIDDNGFVRFTTVGGVRAFHLMGGRVRFLNGAPISAGSSRGRSAFALGSSRDSGRSRRSPR